MFCLCHTPRSYTCSQSHDIAAQVWEVRLNESKRDWELQCISNNPQQLTDDKLSPFDWADGHVLVALPLPGKERFSFEGREVVVSKKGYLQRFVKGSSLWDLPRQELDKYRGKWGYQVMF